MWAFFKKWSVFFAFLEALINCGVTYDVFYCSLSEPFSFYETKKSSVCSFVNFEEDRKLSVSLFVTELFVFRFAGNLNFKNFNRTITYSNVSTIASIQLIKLNYW